MPSILLRQLNSMLPAVPYHAGSGPPGSKASAVNPMQLLSKHTAYGQVKR